MSSRSSSPGRPVSSTVSADIGTNVRFQPSDEQWTAIAQALSLKDLSANDRKAISRCADAYIQERSLAMTAIPTAELVRRAQRARVTLGELSEAISTHGDDIEDQVIRTTFVRELNTDADDLGLPNLRPITSALSQLDQLLAASLVRWNQAISDRDREPTASELRGQFISDMAFEYERISGKRPTIRGDSDAYGRYSPIIHFLCAVWTALSEPGDAPTPARMSEWTKRARKKSGDFWGASAARKAPLSR